MRIIRTLLQHLCETSTDISFYNQTSAAWSVA
jgi:hypothetical protein